ncbi:DNA double-strand break repair rad50 ATPase [Hibiscus syriacus]|uniref:DNA double-strand break repair rad50 ATPase n=1 Tax=Hibiscus syriacus TaxID=106335 RepID=A0A6A3AQ23_HIBSY|nr:DNA double-strand break repair rad50 ATPase [Hibiscus syriacus]
MESIRKRRGFLKAKLTPLYRAAKPGSATSVMPNQASATTAPFSLRVHRDYNVSQPKQVSFFVPADKKRENLSQIDTFFGVAGDEAVDIKAATYISLVQERFKLEPNNSEQVKLQETH